MILIGRRRLNAMVVVKSIQIDAAQQEIVAIRVILTMGSHLYQTKARWLCTITPGISYCVGLSRAFVMLR